MSPNSNCPLPIKCPKCDQEGCELVVKSMSVMTCTCTKCDYTWSAPTASLPEAIEKRVAT